VPVWLSPWAWTATDWAGVQCIVLVVAAVIAFRQVREARGLREAQARPFVVVDFEADRQTQAIYIVISNVGSTMARDVRLTFTPSLTSSLDANPNIVPPRDLKPLSEGIASLPPGKRIQVMLDMFTQRAAESYPDAYEVNVRFRAPALDRNLSDDTVLDLGVYRNVLHPNRNDLHDVHARLKELVAAVKSLQGSLTEQR
jgi:hypothetical protein